MCKLSLVAASRGYSLLILAALGGLLIAVTCLVAEHRLSSCGPLDLVAT